MTNKLRFIWLQKYTKTMVILFEEYVKLPLYTLFREHFRNLTHLKVEEVDFSICRMTEVLSRTL